MPEESFAESAEVAMEAMADEARAEGRSVAKWIQWASLSTMVMALFSAAGGLLAGKTANEAIIKRQEEIQDLIELTRMELESEMLRTRLVVLKSAGEQPGQELLDRIQASDLVLPERARAIAKDLEASDTELYMHEVFAIATTILSVAITLTGMSVIVRHKRLWLMGLLIAFGGAGMVIYGMIRTATS